MALEADARHLFTDVWTSAGVVVGLLAVQATGWLWLDPVIAIARGAEHRCAKACNLVWRSADGLMDRPWSPRRAPDRQGAGRLRPPTIRFDHVVTRRAGQRRLSTCTCTCRRWTLGRAAAVRTSVEQALMSAVPGLRATIQLLPMDVEAHFDDPKDPL
jgi:divalent metal cation (Fe/Co/Zn/Cd) transporter